jgi:isoamylase
MLSHGVPMLTAGDEIGRTQHGNNNAYCQDNDLSWVDWQLDGSQWALLEFTRAVIGLRRNHPVFRRRGFFFGRPIRGSEVKDLAWFRPDGREMTEEDWNNPATRCFGLRLAGDAIPEVDSDGRPVRDHTFLMLINAHYEPVPFVLPAHHPRVRWELLLDTPEEHPPQRRTAFRGGHEYALPARSLALFAVGSTAAPASRFRAFRMRRRAAAPARAGVVEPAG